MYTNLLKQCINFSKYRIYASTHETNLGISLLKPKCNELLFFYQYFKSCALYIQNQMQNRKN